MADQASKSTIEKLEDGAIKITMPISWAEIKPTWDEVMAIFIAESKLPGFRKGKAPKELIEKQINKAAIREEVLRKVLPKAYIQAINKYGVKPIIEPRIHVHSAKGEGELKEGEDWIFEAETAEAPIIDLGNYKDKIKAITAKSKIIIPGKDLPAGRQEPQEPKFEVLIQALLESTIVKVPQIIIQREADRLLAQSLDEIKKLGLTLDQYLSSTGRDPKAFRQEYETKAQNDLKLEFALQKIAEEEKITVNDVDIQKTIATAKTDTEKQDMERNKYLIASILRQQKTLDFIKSL